MWTSASTATPAQTAPRRTTLGTRCAALLGCRLLPLVGSVLLIGACVSTAEVMIAERVPTPVQRLVLLVLVAIVLIATLALLLAQTCGIPWTQSPTDSTGAWAPPDPSDHPQPPQLPPSRARLRPLPQQQQRPFPPGASEPHAGPVLSPRFELSSLSAPGAGALQSNPAEVSSMPSVRFTPLPPISGLST